MLAIDPSDSHNTHGMSYSYEYCAWQNMKSRCGNPKNHKFPMYGGRGIKVCDAWVNSFESFYASMGARPSPNHSVDRIDSNGNYSPENCRWADKKLQSENRPGWVRWLEFNGQKKTITEWAKEIGIARRSLSDRIDSGWSVEKALTTPKRGKLG
jgi:hypothetical protein